MRYDAIMFDFDGVLAESADLKTEAFRALYEEHGPDILAKVLAHHGAHEGISRVEKIKFCHREYLGIELDADALAAEERRYSDLVKGRVVACDAVPGSREFLEAHRGQLKMFVISGTPEPELRDIVAARGMSEYFNAVYGSPQGMLVRAALKEKPSFYFRRQCWISGDPDETSLAAIIPIVGADRFFWASDFPHPDHPPEYVPEVARLTRELPESAREGFLGANVLRAFGIEQ